MGQKEIHGERLLHCRHCPPPTLDVPLLQVCPVVLAVTSHGVEGSLRIVHPHLRRLLLQALLLLPLPLRLLRGRLPRLLLVRASALHPAADRAAGK